MEVTTAILPDGYFDLVIGFKEKKLKTVELTGIWTEIKYIKINKNTLFFGLRFKLLACEYFFDEEIKSIVNTIKKLPLSFWNINSYNYNEFKKFTSEISLKLIEIVKNKEVDKQKLQLFDMVYEQKIQSVSEISKQTFWGSRQINRYFQNQFGISLKTLIKIVRFNASYRKISDKNLNPQTNYFDQAHFIKDIKSFTGITPKELNKQKNVRFLQLSDLINI